MHKVIKKIKENEYTYELGYNLYYDKIYPRIEIYKNGKSFSGGYRNDETIGGSFTFYIYNFWSDNSYIDTIKEMFIVLRRYSKIPKYIEEEYESLYLLYKLNDFKI